MTTFKGHRRFLVSNRLALIAGLVLAITAHNAAPVDQLGVDGKANPTIQQASDAGGDNDVSVQNPKLNVRFLLFRHG